MISRNRRKPELPFWNCSTNCVSFRIGAMNTETYSENVMRSTASILPCIMNTPPAASVTSCMSAMANSVEALNTPKMR